MEGGENEEGPDASMKSHVPSRVHRNVGRLATVSGYARACWWSPGFSSAQVDATRAPHARRARGTAEGGGEGRRASSKRGGGSRGGGGRQARSTVGGTKSRKIQVAP